jgi:ATP-dependent DNA helicase RecG
MTYQNGSAQPEQARLAFDRLPMMMPVADLWDLASADLLTVLPEDRRVERKPSGIHAPELAEYFSMWANTAAEGGLVAVGMSNDGKFLGCLGIEVAHLNRLEHESHNLCPDAHVQCRRIDCVRTKTGAPDFMLLFRIHYNETKVVHTARGDAYIRRGESKHGSVRRHR